MLELIWPPEFGRDLRVAVEADVGQRGFSRVARVGDGVALLGAEDLVLWRGPGEVSRHAPRDLEVSRRLRRWRVSLAGAKAGAASDNTEKDTSEDEHDPVAMFEVDEAFARRVEALKASCERRETDPGVWSRTLARPTNQTDAPDDAATSLPTRASQPVESRRVDAARQLADADPPTPRTATERLAVASQTATVVSVLAPCGYVRTAEDRLVPARIAPTAAPIPIGAVVALSRNRNGRLVAASTPSLEPETTGAPS